MFPARIRGRTDGVRANIHADVHRHGEAQGGQEPPEVLRTRLARIPLQTRPGVDRRVSFSLACI